MLYILLKTIASRRCLIVDKSKMRNYQIIYNCLGEIYNVLLLHIGVDIKCLDYKHIVSYHKDYNINFYLYPATLLLQYRDFLMTVFYFLIVTYIYNCIIDDFFTGFPINMASNISFDVIFYLGITTIEKLFQMIIHIYIVYIKRTSAYGKSTMATLLYQYGFDLYRYQKVYQFTST